jgi:hypothetical protein
MEMSLYELHTIWGTYNESADRLWEFWITGTFAIIVASHLGSEKISQKYAIAMASIYTLFTISLVVRMIITVDGLREYGKKMGSITGEYWSTEMFWSMGISHALLFAFGFLGTLFFVWQSYREGITAKDKTIVADSPQP